MKNKSVKSRSAFAATAGMVWAVAICEATVVVPMTFDGLCERSEVVFFGRVASVESRRDAGSGAIHTYTTFDQVRWVAGESNEATTYTVRTLGGEADGEVLTVHEMPRFETGHSYVLFVRGNNRAACPVVGWGQGCYHVIEQDGAHFVETYGRRRVTKLGGRTPDGAERKARKSRDNFPTLDSFLDAVRDGVARANRPAAEGR